MKTVKFGDLALGARFRYEKDFKIFVKIGAKMVAQWDANNIDTRWVGQGIFAASDDGEDFDVVLLG